MANQLTDFYVIQVFSERYFQTNYIINEYSMKVRYLKKRKMKHIVYYYTVLLSGSSVRLVSS